MASAIILEVGVADKDDNCFVSFFWSLLFLLVFSGGVTCDETYRIFYTYPMKCRLVSRGCLLDNFRSSDVYQLFPVFYVWTSSGIDGKTSKHEISGTIYIHKSPDLVEIFGDVYWNWGCSSGVLYKYAVISKG